jgi:hypothetical protein
MKDEALLVVIAATIYGSVAGSVKDNDKEALTQAREILAGANVEAKGDVDMRDALALGAAAIYAAQAQIAGVRTLANIPGGTGGAVGWTARFAELVKQK